MHGDWEMIGGRPGGTVTALAALDDDSSILFAATPVGVHVSHDRGSTWIPAGLGHTGALVEIVLPSPAFRTDRTVFAGGRDGLYRSLNGGATWSRVLAVGNVTWLTLSADYVRDHTVLASTEDAGILRSADGGQSWEWANLGLLDLRVLAVTFSSDPGATRHGLAATASGLYRSGNGGKTWRHVWPDRGESAVQCLRACPDGVVLAGTEQDGLLRSVDGGKRWEEIADLAGQGVMAIASSQMGSVAVGTTDGIVVSTDAGQHWRLAGGALNPALSLSLMPSERGERLLAGLAHRGVAQSDDYGDTWKLESPGLQGKLPGGLVLSPGFANDQTLFAFGPDDGVVVSLDGGTAWQEVGPCGSIAGLALSRTFPADQRIFCAADSGLYLGLDRPGNWSRIATQAATVVATHGDVVLTALEGGEIIVSEDRGSTWISLGVVPGTGDVVALAFSPALGIFAIRPNADQEPSHQAVWRRSETASHWEPWWEGRSDRPLSIAIPPPGERSDGVFVALNDSVMSLSVDSDDVSGRNGSPAWRRNQLGELSITALEVSPTFEQDSAVFVATSAGVYLSEDAGTSFELWDDLQSLPPMVALAVSPNHSCDGLVYGATLGGAIWRRVPQMGFGEDQASV